MNNYSTIYSFLWLSPSLYKQKQKQFWFHFCWLSWSTKMKTILKIPWPSQVFLIDSCTVLKYWYDSTVSLTMIPGTVHKRILRSISCLTVSGFALSFLPLSLYLYALQEGPAIRCKSWMREYTRRPEEKPLPVSCLAGSKLDRPARLFCCWRLQKICSICSINLLTEN